jgi:hypothetical protein
MMNFPLPTFASNQSLLCAEHLVVNEVLIGGLDTGIQLNLPGALHKTFSVFCDYLAEFQDPTTIQLAPVLLPWGPKARVALPLSNHEMMIMNIE